MKKEKSQALFKKAKAYFPGGVNSPVRAFRAVACPDIVGSETPLFIERGKGAYIRDADGNKYIDFCCSWGPLILGHAHPKVVEAITETARKGTSFGTSTGLENKLAELILKNIPFIEKIRFVSSGTEAVMSAIRLARGFTKRNKILKFEGCYHGHSDSLLVKAGSGLVTFGNSSSAGVPEAFVKETIVCPLNNPQAVKKAFVKFKNEIACVIIEPIPANNGLLLQDKSYLQFLRDICTENKSLLIFDEVISGFRIGFTGAAGYYNIFPDIVTYGKIIGGGLPVGAYASSAEIMSRISPDGDVYQAGTLSGNPVAMAAGIAQLTECLKPNFYTKLEAKTKHFVSEINKQLVRQKDGLFRLSGRNPSFSGSQSGATCNLQLTRSQKPEASNMKIFSIGSIFWLAFTEKEKIQSTDEIDPNSMQHFRKLYHRLLAHGVYLGPSGYEVGFVSAAHTEDDLKKAGKIIAESSRKIW